MSSSTAARIALAARALLVAEGSAAVSMRKVADAVGITPMAIYRHFPNRDALLAAVAAAEFDALAASWGEALAPDRDADLDGRLARTLERHLDFALGAPHLYMFLFAEARTGARTYAADLKHRRSPTLTLVMDALKRGQQSGIFVEHDEGELALVIAAELQGLVQLYLGGRIGLEESEFRALAGRAVARILDGVRA